MEPIIYEVNIKAIESPFDQEGFLKWLREHVVEMEAIEGFLPKTELLLVEDENFHVSIRYTLESQKAFDRYLDGFAAKMRDALDPGVKKKLEFSRRVLKALS